MTPQTTPPQSPAGCGHAPSSLGEPYRTIVGQAIGNLCTLMSALVRVLDGTGNSR